MPLNENKDNPPKKRSLNSYARYSTLGFTMIAVILLGVFGGQWVDKYFEFKIPIFTASCTILALIFALYYLIKEVTRK
ncbi:MAG: AtpZ/AtpI family protein [Sphingobacteriales bacterium JAD_PAG50586_3]|nr:MAG: AtpZ/AtpI family protein [Sphingobacteriales bacterium JAD_PAG50586_3]